MGKVGSSWYLLGRLVSIPGKGLQYGRGDGAYYWTEWLGIFRRPSFQHILSFSAMGLLPSLATRWLSNRIDLLADNCVFCAKLPKEKTSLWASLLAVFLPAGYPHSVTDDYMWYVTYIIPLFKYFHFFGR